MLDADVVHVHPDKLISDPEQVKTALAGADLVFVTSGGVLGRVRDLGASPSPQIVIPRFFFRGFHPDAVWSRFSEKSAPPSPLGNTHSALILMAWHAGMTREEAIGLFRAEVFERLGYFSALDRSCEAFAAQCQEIGFDVWPMIRRWREEGSFMHQPQHPHKRVLADITQHQLAALGVETDAAKIADVEDDFTHNAVWPIYPEIAEHHGIVGDYVFRPKNTGRRTHAKYDPIGLEAFIDRCYAIYDESAPVLSLFADLNPAKYERVIANAVAV